MLAENRKSDFIPLYFADSVPENISGWLTKLPESINANGTIVRE